MAERKDDGKIKIWLGGYDVFGVGETEGVYIYMQYCTYVYLYVFMYIYI